MREQCSCRSLLGWTWRLLFLWAMTIAPSAFAQFSSYLGVTLSELQAALEKGGGPLAFAPRPGSAQNTQEARLLENAGVVQAGGSAGNLSVVVLWLPTDGKGKFASVKTRLYLDAFAQLFTDDSAPLVRWVEQVLERAVTEGGDTPSLESQLLDERQFKAMYTPTLSPPMLSLTVEASGSGASR